MLKIISGGQTGVDRAALDAALELGYPCGGWCPEGREAEDGTIPLHYPVQELEGSRYSQRTKRNITDSDATLIIYRDAPVGGTALTAKFCIKLQKPHLLLDITTTSQDKALSRLKRFLDEFSPITKLNVAGPRFSTTPEAYPYTYNLIHSVLSS